MKTRKIAAAAASLGIIASMVALIPMNAAADGYTPINGTNFQFGKYLVMEKEATVPNVSFSFSVAPASGTDLTPVAGSPFVLKAGPDGIKFTASTTENVAVTASTPTSATVSFASSDNSKTIDEINAGDSRTISFMTSENAVDEKFAEKNITLDLTGVEFSEPGVYRYVITEDSSTNYAGVAVDTDNKRYLDCYVTADAAGDLHVREFVFYVDAEHKSTGFTNQYKTDNLFIQKNVAGNQGSKIKHFKVRVKLTKPESLNIDDNDTFQIIGNRELEPEGNGSTLYSADTMKAGNNVASLTYAELAAGHDFYLCSGHNIEIRGIPSGLGYEVTEYREGYDASDTYTAGSDTKTGDAEGEGTAIAGVSFADTENSANNTYTLTDTCMKSNTNITLTNTLEGNVPTGVIMSVAASAGIVAVGAAGAACGYFFMKKKKSDEE
ncbi:MAG: hypothetical protein IKW87_12685 [Ruminococcus sp.]|nr:hypothetical protein [Ruminococcus sp.]